MRLLYLTDNGSFGSTEFRRGNIPPYAILSHTWGNEEVSFQDLLNDTYTTKAGYQKIYFCWQQASRDGLKYFWIDTCCIDSRNLVELTRSINSMFKWYKSAVKCYVYLSDVWVPASVHVQSNQYMWERAFRSSRWFTRGWTLQELLAPRIVEFYSAEGTKLGDKSSLELQIHQITDIPREALRGQPLNEFSVEERLAWTEDRETTEEEDAAYCLLGIFDVFMPLIYGEGETNAFRRLQRVIEESLGEESPEILEGDAKSHKRDSFPAPAQGYRPTPIQGYVPTPNQGYYSLPAQGNSSGAPSRGMWFM